MNKKIEDLMYHAGLTAQGCWDEMDEYDRKAIEKFAELIVQECVDRVTTKANGWGDITGFAIKESILDCAKDLKEHFGVEK